MVPEPNKKDILKNDKKGPFQSAKNQSQHNKRMAEGRNYISFKNVHDASEFMLNAELIAKLSIELWRLEKRIDKAEGKVDRSITDQFQRIKNILRKQEIEISEHTGTDYNDGMSIKVLHVEEVDNLVPGNMKIIETVKPSIYYRGQVISHGEVIVGKSNKKEKE